jgi:hypothetical protein
LFTLRYVNTNSCANLAFVTPKSLFNAAVKINALIVNCVRCCFIPVITVRTNVRIRSARRSSNKKRNPCSSITVISHAENSKKI